MNTPAPNIAQKDHMHLETGPRPRSLLANAKSRGASHAQPPVVLGSWRPERRLVRFREVTRGLEGKAAEGRRCRSRLAGAEFMSFAGLVERAVASSWEMKECPSKGTKE